MARGSRAASVANDKDLPGIDEEIDEGVDLLIPNALKGRLDAPDVPAIGHRTHHRASSITLAAYYPL
jgi:hypothetical protein